MCHLAWERVECILDGVSPDLSRESMEIRTRDVVGRLRWERVENIVDDDDNDDDGSATLPQTWAADL